MNDIDPILIKQMEAAPETHALTIGMGVKMLGMKQAVVTIYDGALFKDDTLKDLAINAFRRWMDNSEEVKNWQAFDVWLDEKNAGPYRATRYVTLRKNR